MRIGKLDAGAHAHPPDAISLKDRKGGLPDSSAETAAALGRGADPLNPTIFHEAWWLEIASSGLWAEAEMRVDGAVVGRLPYMRTRRSRLDVCGMPPFVHFLGPALIEGKGGAAARMRRAAEITRGLIDKLPPSHTVVQKCHAGVTDVLPFQTEGFTASVQFTYELPPQPRADLWRGLRDKTRNIVRRAEERCRVETAADPGAFVAFYRRNLAQEGRDSFYEFDRLSVLAEATLARGRGQMLIARNHEDEPVAATFVIWDVSRMYYFMSTRARQAEENGASTLLLWRSIEEATRRGLVFDFDGVFSESQIPFYTGFGGRTAPRYIVHRASGLARAVGIYRETRGLEQRNPYMWPL